MKMLYSNMTDAELIQEAGINGDELAQELADRFDDIIDSVDAFRTILIQVDDGLRPDMEAADLLPKFEDIFSEWLDDGYTD